MYWVLITAITFTILGLVYLILINVPEAHLISANKENEPKSMDMKGTVAAILAVPGLIYLIFFNTFNNLLGGVFMALMDAYGLSLVSVQAWGSIWGFLSLGFIIGGLIIAKKGLGKNPLKTLFLCNIAIWISCLFFPLQPSIILLIIGSAFWMTLFPFIEASEQTILQKVVPLKRQGRVFGFAQSIEQAASPLTAFLIGPITQLYFIPFMSEGGSGANLIGDWFGVGAGRGIALVFIATGIIGLIVTLVAFNSNAYKLLSARYLKK
jgi:DHA3 family multidrug efflux protein-like MFS transporter